MSFELSQATGQGLRRLAVLGFEFPTTTAARCRLVDYVVVSEAAEAGALIVADETIRFASRDLWAAYAEQLETHPNEAVAAHVDVARDATATMRYDVACKHLREALRLQPRVAEATRPRAPLMLDLARAQARAGLVADAWSTCREVAALGMATDQPVVVADAATVIRGGWLSGTGLAAEQHALCQNALRLLPPEEEVRVARLRAQLAATQHPWLRPHRPAPPGGTLDPVPDPEAQFLALQAEQQRSLGPAMTERLCDLGDRAMALGAATGTDEYVAWGVLWRLDALYCLQRRVELDAEMLTFAAVIPRMGQPDWQARLLCGRASLRMLDGDYTSAMQLATEATSILGRSAPDEARFIHLIWFSRIAIMTGAGLEQAEAAVGSFVANLPFHARGWHAGLLSALGRHEQVTTVWKSLAPHLDQMPTSTREWLLAMVDFADTCVEAGDRASAARLYKLLLPYADRHVIGTVLGPPHGPASLYLGRLARLLRNPAAARRHFLAAVRQSNAMHSPPFAALARGELETLARSRSELSHREWEIAGLVADGLSNREMGRRLFISERTVETHVGHMMRKLDLSSRSAIAAWFTRTAS